MAWAQVTPLCGRLPDVAIEVAGAAIVRSGRVLAARRVYPTDVAGGWELPGGKIDGGETAAEAVVREIREELSCEVEVTGSLGGRVPIKPGYELSVHLARLGGDDPEPIGHEHDAVRWLGPEDFDSVAWLEADRAFLPELRALLMAGERLEGGNVGGAVRIGQTVRRAVGVWTPAVHGLLDHLSERGLVQVPRVLGTDESGREVLSFLPGRVPDIDNELAGLEVLADAMRWLRRFHDAVEEFRPSGRWRTIHRPMAEHELVCHHDFAPYNVALSSSAEGERVVGVFDWDMAGPGTRLEDLAFAAWNWVPLWWELAPEVAASRVRVMAQVYGGIAADDILTAVAPRVERSLVVIRSGQAAGDPGMLNLANVGEPARTEASLEALRERIPTIAAALSSCG